MIELLYAINGIVMGLFANKLYNQVKATYDNKKYLKNINDIYTGVIKSIKSGESKFGGRLNKSVTIFIQHDELGAIELLYTIERDSISIFKNDKCLYIDDYLDTSIKNEIVELINTLYKKEMNDCVSVLGFIFSKDEFISRFDWFRENDSNTKHYIKEYKYDLNIDLILDKINIIGYDNLNKTEKEFLEKISEQKKQV